VQRQNSLVVARANVAQGAIATWRALGGGWEVRAGMEFVPRDTIEAMRARTDWGDILSPEYADGSDFFLFPRPNPDAPLPGGRPANENRRPPPCNGQGSRCRARGHVGDRVQAEDQCLRAAATGGGDRRARDPEAGHQLPRVHRTIEPFQTVDLRARVQGFLDQVLFKPGSKVGKGDLLFVIDKRPTRRSSIASKPRSRPT